MFDKNSIWGYVIYLVIFALLITYSIVVIVRKSTLNKKLAIRLNPQVKRNKINKLIRKAYKTARKISGVNLLLDIEVLEILQNKNLLPFDLTKKSINKTNDNLLSLIDDDSDRQVRTKTIAYLKNNKIECYPHYIFCDSTKKYTRSKEEIVDRLLCMCCNVYLSNQFVTNAINKEKLIENLGKFIKKYQLKGKFTEIEMNAYKRLDQQDLMNFSWQTECIETLFWSLGLIDELEVSKKHEYKFMTEMQKILNMSKQEILDKFDIRDYEQLFQMLDIYFICQHSVNHSRYLNKTIKEVNPEVIEERLKTLVWIMEDLNQDGDYNPTLKEKINEWDNVDTSA